MNPMSLYLNLALSQTVVISSSCTMWIIGKVKNFAKFQGRCRLFVLTWILDQKHVTLKHHQFLLSLLGSILLPK